MTDTSGLWRAVDAITNPTTRRVNRDTESDWLTELSDPRYGLGYCRISDYHAATDGHGKIPSLWQQATWALTTGSEQSEGGGRTPLRERSPADLDLMETMTMIRETVAERLRNLDSPPRSEWLPAQLRHLASEVIRQHPEHVDWWTFRIDQWARLLATHLDALDAGPKPVYLRNAACPACAARTVTIDRDGEPTRVPALVIDFRDGYIRAATCQACTATWFRGDDLGELANALEQTA